MVRGYTSVLAERFGDRVKDFITFNEPQCVIGLGYMLGVHAPGLKLDVKDQVTASHNLLKSHGRACQVLREKVQDVRIGYAPCGGPAIPRDKTIRQMWKRHGKLILPRTRTVRLFQCPGSAIRQFSEDIRMTA